MKDQNQQQYKFSLPKELTEIIPGEEVLYLDWINNRERISNKPGLYAFWWHGDSAILNGDQEVEFTGPAFQEIDDDGKKIKSDRRHRSNFTIADEHKLLSVDPICLYVGKSTNIRGRIAQHLKPSMKTSTRFSTIHHKDGSKTVKCNYSDQVSTVCKRDSSSQFRAGMEYLLRIQAKKDDSYVFRMIKENVGITFLPLEDDNDVANPNHAFKRRFYWEDLLIGVLQPWFNLDGER